MSERKNDAATAGAPNELVITRLFDAPRELAFRMFTEIEHIRQWGGPHDYPLVHAEGDLRPGGKWRSCLRARKSGEKMWQSGVYREIVPPERLVYTFAWEEENGNTPNETLITITFANDNGKTRMTFRQAPFVSAESRDGHRKGWNSSFDRLDDYLKGKRAAVQPARQHQKKELK
ncbi:MAG: SRPBCC domain-containing protein [Chthoniobacterales bacterium]